MMDILLVDDEKAILQQARIFLQKENDRFDVFTAPSVERALEMYEENDYDIIVSDYQIPGRDGLDLLRTLREEKNDDIPFIILTGKGREEVAVKALNLNADRYIQKGTDPQSQYSVVAEAIVREVEHKRAQDKIQNLNSLLRSVREINQLIVQEDELETLMGRAAEKLVETRNYYNVEISVLERGSEKIKTIASSGKYPEKEWMMTKDGDGHAPKCVKEVLKDSSPEIIKNPEKYCRDCDYRNDENPQKTLLVPIIHQSNLTGILSACYKSEGKISQDELDLLKEVGEDLGLAREKIIVEEKLRESKERFKNLAETTSVAIMIYQGESWVYVNPAAEDICGYTSEELEEMKYWEFVAPEHREMIKRRGEKRQDEGNTESGYEFKIITKKGEEKWVYLEGSDIEYKGKKAGLISVIDITENKKREEELRKKTKKLKRNEEKIRKLHEVANEMESVVNEEELYELTINAANRILDFQVCRLDIVENEEFEVKSRLGGIHKRGDRHPIEGVAGKTYRKNESFLIHDFSEEGKTDLKGESYKSGMSIPVGEHGVFQVLSEQKGYFDEKDLELSEILIHHTNQVLKRVKSENRIRESEKKYRELTEKVDDLIGKIDEEGRITFANKTHEEVLGYKPEKLIGERAIEYIHEEDRERVLKELGHALEEEGEQKGKVEARFRTKEGNYRWLEVKGKTRVNENKKLVIGRDITERKEKEKELRQKKYTIDSSQNAIAITNMSWEVEYVNQAILDMWGYDKNEILGEIPHHFFHDPERIENALEELIREGEWRGDLLAEKKDGTLFEVHLSANLIKNEKGETTGVSASMIDISEQKNLKRKLRDKEEKIKGLHDIATKLQNFRNESEVFELAVEGAKNTLEFSFSIIALEEDEMVYKSESMEEKIADQELMEIVFDENDSIIIDDLEESKSFEDDDFSSCLITPIGEKGRIAAFSRDRDFFDETDLELTELLVSHLTQVLEQIERETELKTNKRRIQKLHEIGAKLESCQDKDEIYDLTIQAAEDILDFEISEISVPKEGYMIPVATSSAHIEDSPEPLPIDESIAGKTALKNESFLIQDVDSVEEAKPTSDQYNSAVSVPIGDHAVFQAVSTQKNNFDEEDLELLELLVNHTAEALERTEMRAREEFLHSLLRHDVGNKTQIAKGYLELMKNKFEDDDFVQKTINAIDKTQEIIDKINQIRKIDRKEDLGKINVNKILEDVLSDYDSQLEDHGIEVDVSASDFVVKGNVLLEELLSNLIENSIRHSDCDKIKIDVKEEGNDCYCVFEDDGKGLSEGQKDKIFERGYKKGDKAGSGLGMFLVREIVESFNGGISVKDSEMGGVRFDIKLKKAERVD